MLVGSLNICLIQKCLHYQKFLLFINMLSEDNQPRQALTYQIINPYKNFGEGDINSISDKHHGYWKSLIGSDKIIVRCGLKHYCRVTAMEARVQDAHLLEIIGFKDDRYKFEDMKLVGPKEREGQQIIKHEFNTDSIVDEIEVEISSFSKKQIGIYFFIFYGWVEMEKENNTSLVRAQKHLADQRLINQEKTVQKSDIDQSVIQELASNKFSHYKIDKKALAHEQSMKNKLKANQPLIKQSAYEEDKLIQVLEAKENIDQKESALIKIRKDQLEVFEGVSQKWISAQKKFEFQENVATSHQLSVHIEPKCFKNQLFCIANIFGGDKGQLVKLVKEMGGLMRDDACQGCIFVTNSMKGSAVGIAKLMRDVVFVTPAYIEDCHRLKSRLDTRKYSHKVNQDFMYKADE